MDSGSASASNIEAATKRLRRWDESSGGESVATLRKELQSCMQLNFGVFRKEGPMLEGIKKANADFDSAIARRPDDKFARRLQRITMKKWGLLKKARRLEAKEAKRDGR